MLVYDHHVIVDRRFLRQEKSGNTLIFSSIGTEIHQERVCVFTTLLALRWIWRKGLTLVCHRKSMAQNNRGSWWNPTTTIWIIGALSEIT